MADNTKLLLVGGAAAAVWWFYLRTPAPVASAPGAAPPSDGGTPAPPPPPAPAAPAPPPTPGVPTIAAIEAQVLANANAPAAGLGYDQWGWYLNNALAPLGKAAPDPVPIFGADRSQVFTAAQYWGKMEPALRSQLGLSGMRAGLGFFGVIR